MDSNDIAVVAGVVLAGVCVGAVIASGGALAAPLAALTGTAGAAALKAAGA